eukprot:TRINITY_DN25715_c0_g2_i1.p1 TRINITY_DN25715_c0_g2~~TRINITY_DN25715_c0_g2_i1.p1  ORF type:complete len:125 (+),score=13.70 TRINITY_DN25715_c0_g2_i1:118-492(+)
MLRSLVGSEMCIRDRTKMVLEETLEQSGLKKYLQDHTPYNLPLTSGYMRFFNNTGSINQIPASMVWSTEEVSCGALAFWSVGMTSCVPCPVGQKGAGQVCIYNQKNNSKPVSYTHLTLPTKRIV